MKYENTEHTVMNPEGTSFRKALGQMIRGVPGRKPDGAIETAALELPADSAANGFCWLGHSSVYLQLGGTRLLIDPVFSKKASPLPIMGPKAFDYTHTYNPQDFSEVDLILITHDHYDHLDKRTTQYFGSLGKRYIVPRKVKEILVRWGVDASLITEMQWFEQQQVGELLIHSEPARHFSGRGLTNRNSTLWMSYVIEAPGCKVFHSGDSGYGAHFKLIGEKHGPLNLAFIECGQYNVNWPQIHMMPEESVQAATDIRALKMVPIHWSKFALSLHPWREPLERSSVAAKAMGMPLESPMIGQFIPIDVQ